jgi:CheY-like chemotaxis protein
MWCSSISRRTIEAANNDLRIAAGHHELDVHDSEWSRIPEWFSSVQVPRTSRRNDERKPTVLLADDHALVLESASALLADDFEVVAAVTDGRQALDASLRLDPDVIVLDVAMPKLDGIQTARELKRVGSRAKIVFLSMHSADEYVVAALRSGAQGYVLKTRIHSDLKSALDHALAKRFFVPSLTSLFAVADPEAGRHAVQFYANDRAFLDDLAGFLGLALHRGDSVAVVGTDVTRAGIAQRLNGGGWDVAGASAEGRYVALDAGDALSQLLQDGRPDAESVAEIVDCLDRSRVAATGSQSRLTIFGEMSAVLIQNGNYEAVSRLERLWTDLTTALPFVTLCGYPIQCFNPKERPELFASVSAEHWAVCHAHDA